MNKLKARKDTEIAKRIGSMLKKYKVEQATAETLLKNWRMLWRAQTLDLEIAELALLHGRADFIDNLRPREIADVLNSRKVLLSLNQLKLYRGQGFVQNAIIKITGRIVKVVNVGKGLNESGVIMLSEMIFSHYPMLTLADLVLCYRRSLAGYYGEIYDRMDVPVVMGWFRKYMDERLEVAEARSIMAASQFKSQPIFAPEVAEALRKGFAKVDKNLGRPVSTEPMTKSSEQVLMEYCRNNGIDPVKYVANLEKSFKSEYKRLTMTEQNQVKLTTFCALKMIFHIAQLDKPLLDEPKPKSTGTDS